MLRPMSPKIKFASEGRMKDINPETLRLWNLYEMDMSIRELSRATIKAYRNDLEHLWVYTLDHFDNISISELTEDELSEFFYVCTKKGNNTQRMKRRMSTVSAFFRFLRKKKIIQENPMEFIDRPKKRAGVITQTFLTKDDIKLMKEVLADMYERMNSVPGQHRALYYLCYATLSLSTMARVNAICNLKWRQVDLKNRTADNVLEKEGKVVTLYFSPEVAKNLAELKQFRKEHNIDDGGYLFVSKDNGVYKQVTNGTLNQWSKKIGSMIGIPSLHPHDFRHSQATLLKDAGMPLEDIAALLNHESTETTNQYYIKKNESHVISLKDKIEEESEDND